MEISSTNWGKKKTPENKNKALMMPKKGDKTDCMNYRRITLGRNKVLAKIIRCRLDKYHNENVGEYQTEIKPGRSTIDQISIMKRLQENAYEQNLSLMFIDRKQAYDTFKRSKL